MRLNKKRLAALAMSAVMAASAVPFPVYAEELSAGEDVVAAVEVTEPATEATEVPMGTEPSVSFVRYDIEYDSETKTATAKAVWSDGTKTDVPAENISITVKEATCEEKGGVTVLVNWNGNTGKADFDTVEALGHKGDGVEIEHIKKPVTCQEDGLKDIYEKCTVCGKEFLTKANVVIRHTGNEHKFDESKEPKINENDSYYNIKVEDGKFVLDENNKPQLADPALKGWYYVQKYCTVEKQYVNAEKVELSAITASNAIVSDVKGIATSKEKLQQLLDAKEVGQYIDEKDIELKDCDVAGSYVINYYDKSSGDIVSKETVTVAPHHKVSKKIAVFKTKADADQATVKYDAKKDILTVTSNSCVNPIEYTEVTECVAKGCKGASLTAKFAKGPENKTVSDLKITHAVNRQDKVAEITGEHEINETVKKNVENYVKDHKVLVLSEIENIVAVDKDCVKLELPANVCENGGEITINYICTKDKKTVVETAKYTVPASGHKESVPVVENKVEATCAAKGTYDEVTYCARCEKELARVSKVLPRLKHTNESSVGVNKPGKDETTFVKFVGNKVVDNDGYLLDKKHWTINPNNAIGSGISDNKIFPTLYTNCKECNDHEVKLSDKVSTVKVVDIQKEDSKGQNGYIVVEVTFTRPVDGKNETVTTKSEKIPYYSSQQAYNGRVEDAVLNGLHKDNDGVYRYYVNGELQKDYTGMIEDNKEKYLVIKGVLATDMNGLWYSDVDKVWYFFVEGHVRSDYTGIALYDGEWFYVTNGKLDEGVTGLLAYNGGTFLFTEGRLRNDVNGLWQDINNPEDWYFLALGQVQTQYTGVAQYDGAFFVVKNGKLDTSYNGTIKYDGKTFKVVNGQLITK